MSTESGMWTRIQRIELELLETYSELNRARGERDRARSVAVTLEQENAELQVHMRTLSDALDDAIAELETAPLDVVMVPVIGQAT